MAITAGPTAANLVELVGVRTTNRADEAAQQQAAVPAHADLLPVDLNFSTVGDRAKVPSVCHLCLCAMDEEPFAVQHMDVEHGMRFDERRRVDLIAAEALGQSKGTRHFRHKATLTKDVKKGLF